MVVIFSCLGESLRCLADWNTSLPLLEHYPRVAPHPPLSAVCSATLVLLRHFKLSCTQSHLPAFSLTDWTTASSLFRAKDRRMGGIWIELLNDLMDQCLFPAEREGLFVCWLQERSGKSFSTKAVTVRMCNAIHYWCLNNLIPWVCPAPQQQSQTLFGLYFIFIILQMAENGSDEAWVHTMVYTKCQISGSFTGMQFWRAWWSLEMCWRELAFSIGTNI